MPTGLLDTSVVADWHDPSLMAVLPDEIAISAITVAELAAAGRSYGLVVADVVRAGRRPRIRVVGI